ncbi:MAG: diguanylate cyclase, partial [Actinomycetota bacterium]|nr:diguanylate cyclase [Actinomycetota bacterium]
MHTARAGTGEGADPGQADHQHPEIVAPRSGDRPLQPVPSAGRRCDSCGQLMTDPPTGLIERWHWDEVAAETVAQSRVRGESVALIMIDLDRFKDVNDSYGHLAGDAVLAAGGKAHGVIPQSLVDREVAHTGLTTLKVVA